MNLTVSIHPDWLSLPHAMSRVLTAITALERPRPPGDDGSDLTLLLDGLLDTPESLAPAPQPAARPSPAAATPPAGRPVAKPFAGTPVTGSQLYRWCCDRKLLPKANAIGKREGWHKLVTHWDADMVSLAYFELTSAEPAASANGSATAD
jgi:hypothetical protein